LTIAALAGAQDSKGTDFWLAFPGNFNSSEISLFITGDTANPEAWRFLKETRVAVLEKPFAAAAFLDAVRQIAMLATSTTAG